MDQNWRKIPKLYITVKKPEDMILDEFDIFTQTYFGKLTNIAEYFENFPNNNWLSIKDERGNSSFDIACFLGYKNIVLYFLKNGIDPAIVDNKQRNSFHFLLAKKEYSTLMIVVNYMKHQTKEQLFQNIKNLKEMYGIKNSDIKHGEFTGQGFQNEETLNKFQDFMTSIENLAAHTFQEYLKFYRQVLNQQDFNGRNPFHYAISEKSIVDVLDINFEGENGLEDFKFECSQLGNLEDPNTTKPLEPRKYFHTLNELKHFLSPEVYAKISQEFLKEKRLLIRDILNARDCWDETPLHIASRRGNYVLVSFYLKNGAKLNQNINGKFPLDLAKDKFTRKALTNLNKEALNCSENNINELVENGEDVNQRISIFGEPPLHMAIASKKPNISTIRTLLDNEADVNMTDYNGWTALHHAAHKGDLEASVELIQNGANVNAYSTSMKTPMHLAAYYNHAEIIHLLASAGASLEGVSNDELLQYAKRKNSVLAENVSPLLQAAKRGNMEWFELLLNLGAFFITKDIRNWNCLHYATYHNHLKMIALILRLDWQQNRLRYMKNTQGHYPQALWACLKAKLLYDEEWFPEEEGEGEEEQSEEEENSENQMEEVQAQ